MALPRALSGLDLSRRFDNGPAPAPMSLRASNDVSTAAQAAMVLEHRGQALRATKIGDAASDMAALKSLAGGTPTSQPAPTSPAVAYGLGAGIPGLLGLLFLGPVGLVVGASLGGGATYWSRMPAHQTAATGKDLTMTGTWRADGSYLDAKSRTWNVDPLSLALADGTVTYVRNDGAKLNGNIPKTNDDLNAWAIRMDTSP